jgi:hypothetical protein
MGEDGMTPEEKLDALRDAWSDPKWLQFSMKALHQIRDHVLSIVDAPDE